MYAPTSVANSFLSIVESEGNTLDPMKLQKLVFFSHGWHLAYDRGALSSERAQAWRWGPVFPSLYRAVKIWGSGPITDPVKAWEFSYNDPRQTVSSVPEDDGFATELIGQVWKVYGHMSGLALSQLTHEKNGPWQTVYSKNPGALDVEIPDPLIRDYFMKKLEKNRAKKLDAGT